MNEVETLNKLAEILGSSGGVAVTEYTIYFVYNSIMWVSIGLLILGIALKWKLPEDWDFPPVILQWVAIVVGLLFIGCNFPDMFAPKAMAIHQLINDVRGS